ncbi:MAG: hypothetical protein HY319_05745 [Armatimonadetes bacterium]|nr:hypothetical protein [Armatimonadota bacterium]
MRAPESRLHLFVADLASEAKARCPEAHVLISYQPYETEDANLRVFCPESWELDQCWELAERLGERSSRILVEEGFFIPVLVMEPPERVRREDEVYRLSLRKEAS